MIRTTKQRIRLSVILLIAFSAAAGAQKTDSLAFSLNTRYSFHTFEENAEMIIHVPQAYISKRLTVLVTLMNGDTVCKWSGPARNRIVRIPFKLITETGFHSLKAEILVEGSLTRFIAKTELVKLDYKSNEVKTDRLTGGLIVNRRQFFPAGFYCYSPVHSTLPEEEAVRGFNMISPYQKILPSSFPERKAYMDRCAQLGMKVHYNLLSVAGGGGVASQTEGITASEKKTLLLNEIKSFRDHPALLAWYIADEPNGYRIPPDTIRAIYDLIRENDPWHPVSVVFMAPFTDARKYASALDIVMADPYPIPVSPVTMPGNVAKSLSNEFRARRPVWMVPQAFGGGELWHREPTVQEIRAMTYQSIINGVTGIQYFVREGLNLFPKSTALWNECGKMAVEIAEMTPWLLSDETTVPVSSGSENIMLASFVHNGRLMILAANRLNRPVRADFSISSSFSGRARVLFENRYLTLKDGKFSDHLSALGTQVYLINHVTLKENLKPYRGNLIRDPGFEDMSSPGIPASCYAWNNGDRGATFFLDSREHAEGYHSLRLVTPVSNRSARLRFFPFKTSPGKTYYISVMAKADPEIIPDNSGTGNTVYFEISLGNYGTRRFALSKEWKEYVAAITIPAGDNIPPKTNVILQLPSAGVAWFDMLQAIEGVDVNRSINPELKFIREW